MKNFNLLLEEIQQLLLEASFKPLYKDWQEAFLKSLDIPTYNDLTADQKKQYIEFVQVREDLINQSFNTIKGIEENQKQWWINIFATQQQDYKTDRIKMINQMNLYNELKRRNKLTKHERNLNKLSYTDFYRIIEKYSNEEADENDFGKNEVLHEDGEWKIIIFTKYEDALPYITGSKSNWCIKYNDNWHEYRPPFYCFYKNNRAYALFHMNSLQLKDKQDNVFKTIDDDFQKQIIWLFDRINIRDLQTVTNDVMCLLEKDFDTFKSYFDEAAIVEFAKSNKKEKLFYKLMKEFPYLQNLYNYRDFKDHKEDQLHKACVEGDIETVDKLLANNKHLHTSYSNVLQSSSFLMAVKYGHLDIVKKFKEAGVQEKQINRNWTEEYMESALLLSIKNNQNKMTEYLMDNFEINVNDWDRHGKTALIYACEMNNLDLVKLLIKRYPELDINQKDDYETSALIFASRYGFDKIVQELLKYHKLRINAPDNDGNSALMEACQFNKDKVVELLLADDRTDLNIRARWDETTALVISLDNKNEKIVKMLLDDPRQEIDYLFKDGYRIHELPPTLQELIQNAKKRLDIKQ